MGGGARIPIVTTTLSEHFRVPVITTGQPELTAAIGGGLRAARGTVDEGQTSMAAGPGVAAAAAAATAMAPGVDPQDAPVSSTFRALAWSDADDVPDVAPTDPYEYGDVANGGVTDARPQMQFDHEQYEHESGTAAVVPQARDHPGRRRGRAAGGARGRGVVRDARPQHTGTHVDHRARHHHDADFDDDRCGAAPGRPRAADTGAPDPHRDSAGAAAAGDRHGGPATPAADVRGAATASAHHGGPAANHRGAACAATVHASADHPLPRRADDSDRPATAATASLAMVRVLGSRA